MSAVWGQRIQLTIFGESHGEGVGMVMDGLPPGLSLDMDKIQADMARRAPGQPPFATPRKEADTPHILSGYWQNRTTGTPLCVWIANTDTRSQDYDQPLFRPGHADLTAFYKYKGYADPRGGGHFSGRLTAPLCFAGAVAKQILWQQGIVAAARITAIAGIADEPTDPERLPEIAQKPFPVAGADSERLMSAAILKAKAEGDSVGGIVEGVLLGLPPGLGSPFFGSCESVISSLLFSIPAVKGVEFGDGFALGGMRGSEANDPIRVQGGKLTLSNNRSGGINGGLTNGMPLVIRVAIRPTPTIGKEQETVCPKTMENAVIAGKGRHDACIVPRVVPVIEAALALSALEWLL